MEEIWKDIEGFEGRYLISNKGNVMSIHFKGSKYSKCLHPTPSPTGYLAVIFYEKGKPRRFYVHRLVANAFIRNDLNLPEVNHIDGNKANNSVENLEWCTPSHNKAHGVKTGLYNGMVARVISQMKPFIGINVKTGEAHTFYSLRDAAAFTGANTANISKVLHGCTKTAKGYTYKYIEEGEDVCKDLIISRLQQKKLKKGLFATSRLLQEAVC